MFQHQGIWLPDGERHFPEWMDRNGELVDGKGTYQIKKLRAALDHCRNFRVAVDVGAHVGLWSMQLLKRFSHVWAFEPVAEFRECWKRNVRGDADHIAGLVHCALGPGDDRVAMLTPKLDGGIDSGGTRVCQMRDLDPKDGVEMKALDSFSLQNVDFIKIDCEGFEHHVVAGARETLNRCRPCVIVEQKPHKLGVNYGIRGTPAVDLLRTLGMQVVREIGGDYILVFA